MGLKAMTAEAIGIPASRMVMLMELAAVRLMRPLLADGETSVPIGMNLTHAAPPVGGRLRAVASYASTSGRVHRFRINVFDESGLIASAEHTRVVVSERRAIAQERSRAGIAGNLLTA